MPVNKPPKWQQEVEKILLKSELTSGEPDMKTTSILGDTKDKGRTLDQLKKDWGSPAKWETPQNYRGSARLLQKHYRIWRQACRRALHQYEQVAHMLEVDAPSIIIDNEKVMLAEACRYLSFVTDTLSFNLLLGAYKPPKRRWDKYYEWVGTKLKIKDASPGDAAHFFMLFGTRGNFGFRRRNDSVEIIFYFPKGKEPEGWKGKELRYGQG